MLNSKVSKDYIECICVYGANMEEKNFIQQSGVHFESFIIYDNSVFVMKRSLVNMGV